MIFPACVTGTPCRIDPSASATDCPPMAGRPVQCLHTHREQLAMPPVSLNLDEPGVDRLSALISAWALAGLAQANVHGSRVLTFLSGTSAFPPQLTRPNRPPDSLEYPRCVGVCGAGVTPLLEGLFKAVVRLLSGRALSCDFGCRKSLLPAGQQANRPSPQTQARRFVTGEAVEASDKARGYEISENEFLFVEDRDLAQSA